MQADFVPTPSRFLRSDCCDAPVIQSYEKWVDLVPVHCTRCGVELGAPGREDVDPPRLSVRAQAWWLEHLGWKH